jgi:protocatechuate 3,4-dioxygenase beta subunit
MTTKGKKQSSPAPAPQPDSYQPLVDALYEAFTAVPEQEVIPKLGMDETAPGGLYIVRGRVVDANGNPIPGYVVVDGQPVKR